MEVKATFAGRIYGLLLAWATLCHGAAYADNGGPANADEAVFAVVNGTVLTVRELDVAFKSALSSKFYHGNVPEGQEAAVRAEVADALVERVLMQGEIARLGIKPQAESIEKSLAEYEARYKSAPRWQQEREKVLPGLKAELEKRNQFEQLEAKLREAPPPAPEEVVAYYERKPEFFTEPEKVRLSIILLKVAPSAGRPAWEKAHEEALSIFQRLQKGANFADAARLHSGDSSAAQGGDMGYIHRGMLPETLEKLLDTLKPGSISEPFSLLEGVALVRLDERVEAKLRAFDDVKSRAAELLARERAAEARATAIARLKGAAVIEIKTPVNPASAK